MAKNLAHFEVPSKKREKTVSALIVPTLTPVTSMDKTVV